MIFFARVGIYFLDWDIIVFGLVKFRIHFWEIIISGLGKQEFRPRISNLLLGNYHIRIGESDFPAPYFEFTSHTWIIVFAIKLTCEVSEFGVGIMISRCKIHNPDSYVSLTTENYILSKKIP